MMRSGLAFVVVSLLVVACYGKNLVNDKTLEESLAYWTPARMLKAVPKDNGKEINVTEVMESYKPNGPQINTPSGLEASRIEFNHSGGVKSPMACAFGTGDAPVNTSPWNVVGKVFFNLNGVDYVCSAAAICNYAVITAGHCTYAPTNVYASYFIFVPGYSCDNAGNPVIPIAFPGRYVFLHPNYIASASKCHDYAFVTLCRANGLTVGQAVSWYGVGFNVNPSLNTASNSYVSLGYPSVPPLFDGCKNHFSQTPFCEWDPAPQTCTPQPWGVGSDSTGGASGGPIVFNFGSLYQVHSVNSFGYSSRINLMYGPYLDTNAYNLYLNSCFDAGC